MKRQAPATVRGRRSASPAKPVRVHPERRRRAKEVAPRWDKLRRLGQAHLAPGMSLQRWRDLLDLYDIGELLDAPDARIDGLIKEISEIVKLAKERTLPNETRIENQ